RQQVGVAPDRQRAGGDALTAGAGRDGVVVVADLQGAEAVIANVQSLGRVPARALSTDESFDESHELPPHRSGIGTWWDQPTGCRGFVGPVPPPLWMIATMKPAIGAHVKALGFALWATGVSSLVPPCRLPQSVLST